MFVRVENKKNHIKIQYVNSGYNEYFHLDDKIIERDNPLFPKLWKMLLTYAPNTCTPLAIPTSCEFLIPEKEYKKLIS